MSEQMNLIQKLASIRRELKNIEKKGRNTFQNYDYLRAEDIAGEMGDRLAAMNVIVARRNLSFVQDNITVVKETTQRDGSVEKAERTDVHVIVTLDYVFIDGDSGLPAAAGDDGNNGFGGYCSISVSSIGEGRDSGDKAVAKAMTNALKYALTQPLMMRVGDDPEADAPHDKLETRKTHASVTGRGADADADTPEGRKTSQNMDAALLSTRKSLREKAAHILGDDSRGLAWLKTEFEKRGLTSQTANLVQLAEVSTELSSLPPADDGQKEDRDINW